MAEERWEAERPVRLEDLLSRQWPKDKASLSRVETEELSFLKRMQELARGLVGSEYWELVKLLIVSDMEDAKGALEDTSIGEKDLRVKQGAVKAIRELHNFILTLSKIEVEEENGEEHNRLQSDES